MPSNSLLASEAVPSVRFQRVIFLLTVCGVARGPVVCFSLRARGDEPNILKIDHPSMREACRGGLGISRQIPIQLRE